MAVIRDANSEARHRLCQKLESQGTDPRVVEAFWKVARHHFIESALAFRAYEDVTLPIGYQQTLSRPSVVAYQLTQLLKDRERLRFVLEIGTGSGYQTALLTHLCTRVYSVERIEGLHKIALHRLAGLGQRNFRLRMGDGLEGWSGVGRFDGIVAAASPGHVPTAWVEQLSPDGVLVMPLDLGNAQRMIRVDNHAEGVKTTDLATASFVPCLSGVQQ